MARECLRLLALVVAMLAVFPSRKAVAANSLYEELVRKSKSDGEVEFWSAIDQEPMENVFRVFSKEFGIKARYKFWRGTGVQQRTLVELQSGRKVSADVISPGQEAEQQFLDAGVFQKPAYEYSKIWPEIDKRQYEPSGWGLYIAGNSRAIAYNPKLVPPELVPQTWDDCTRPAFKGKVALDPRHKLLALHWHKREWFLDWVKRMMANDVKLIREQTETIQLLSNGAYALFCSAQPYSVQSLIDKGAQNVKIVVPGELLIESSQPSFIRKGSPHPHAAQLLVGWLASEEGQRLLDKEDYRGFPWVKGTFNSKLAQGNKILHCGPECVSKAGEMGIEYIKALGLPVTK